VTLPGQETTNTDDVQAAAWRLLSKLTGALFPISSVWLRFGSPLAGEDGHDSVMNRMLTPGEPVRYRADAYLLAILPGPSGFCGIQEYEGGVIFYVHESRIKQDLVADVIWNEKSK
jgi:hypothetical protein